MNLYVGNLPKTTNEADVRKTFEAHGEVSEVKLIKDNDTQELRGFGFIEMPTKSEAQDAIDKVHGSEMEGRNLIVNEARPRRENTGRGYQGGGFSR